MRGIWSAVLQCFQACFLVVVVFIERIRCDWVKSLRSFSDWVLKG